MIQIGHMCGLFNRLDVLCTGLVLASQRGEEEVEFHWPVNEALPAHFDELFDPIPGVRVIERDVDPSLVQAYRDHLSTLSEYYRDSATYRRMLRRVVDRANPAVRDAAAEFEMAHGCLPGAEGGRAGVHVRRCEQHGRISPFAQPSRYYEAVMRAFPDDTRFFVSTDSVEAFAWLRERFGDRVFQREKLVNNRSSVAGVREGFVDMLLLSRCDAIIGTYASSFSALSAYAGDRPILMIRPRPDVPAGWINFSRWRWIWAHRHFVLESTYWKVMSRRSSVAQRCLGGSRKCLARIRLFSPFLWWGRAP